MPSAGDGSNPINKPSPQPDQAVPGDRIDLPDAPDNLAPRDASSTIPTDVNATGAYKPGANPANENGPQSEGANRVGAYLVLGQMFGRYRVERELGRGGMGAVYLALDTHLDRRVALKIPFFLFGNAAELIVRFYREARAMATVHHANICPVYDVGEINGQPFLSMAFIEGQTLTQAQRTRGQIPTPVVAQWMRTIALAVQKAHEAGVIHRDLKPSNVMITVDDEPIVMDFGLARRNKVGEAELTQSGLLLGSPAYMAPEQVEARHQDFGPWTDVWAMGVMLFELLTGHRPFKGTSTAAMLGRIVERDPETFSNLGCVLPATLEAICVKALVKDIKQRYQSARAFADDLARFAARTEAPIVPATPSRASASPLEPESPSDGSHRRRRDAELRQVTIAVFNFELSGINGDVEARNNVTKEFRQFVTTCVKRYNGATMTSSGQEVLACFGFPVAYEDSAQRAIRAALLVLAEAAKHDAAGTALLPPSTSIWATLHTGEVIAEDTDDGENSITVVGEARTMAVRLDGIAEPGSVVVSAATHHQAGLFFETVSLGAQRVRGIPQPVELFRVIKAAASRNRVELVDPGNLTPLVGRDTELSVLKDRWEQAIEELGQVVLLIGDAGLGKSRLIREIREHITATRLEDEPAVIEFRCSQYHQSTGFFPAVEYLTRLLDLERIPTSSDRLKVIEHYLSELGLGSPVEVTLLASLLSVPMDDRYPPLGVTPQRQKEMTDDFLRKWLRELSRRRPTLFIIEDLHWVDPTTLDLIKGHVENFEVGRLLTILTFRPEFQTPWRSFPHQTQIALSRLTKRQIADLMKRSAKRQDIPESVVQQVVERTDGVPLFIEEFTNLVVESGMLDGSVVSDAFVRQTIPATLQDLLIARLDRMASNPDVVQLASAIGREFPYSLLAAASDLPKNELQTELNKLVSAEVLFQKGRIPDAKYIFKHALIQDSAYRSLLKKRRQHFHLKIATALESYFPDVVESQPELLAQHFTQTEQTDKAIAYWQKAGQKSQARSAVLEAVDAFQRGLQIIATLPEGPERDGLELQFQMPLGGAFVQAKGYAAPEPGAAFGRAREICEKLGQKQMLGFVLTGLWGWHLVRAELEHCLRLGNDLLQLSEQLDDSGLRVEACWAMTCTLFYVGRFSESVAHARRGIEMHDRHPELSGPFAAVTGQDAGVTTRGYMALSLFCLGERDAALAASQAAVDLARRMKAPFSLAMAHYHGGWLRLWCGMTAAARDMSNEALTLNRQLSFEHYIKLELLTQAILPILDGGASPEQLEAGVANVRQGMAGYRATGSGVHFSHPFSILANTLLRLGKLDEADAELDSAFANQNATGERFLDAELHRLRAEIQLARGDKQAALDTVTKAIAIAETQQSRAWGKRAEETRMRCVGV